MNERILVVDDEPDIRILLKDILEDEGYSVDVAEHARAANEIRRLSDPDLVLLDIWMPEVDGVLASADILEELAYLGALNDRLAIGTMNRGGIIGADWELDDRLTAYDSDHVEELGLDGGKLLLRIEDTDAGVASTIEMAATIVTELSDRGIMCLVEPLPYLKDAAGRARLDTSLDKLVKVVAVASGLGSSSAYTWLKLPAVAEMDVVAGATSMPILMLGGDPGQNAPAVFDLWCKAMVQPNVRGLVAGRALLYPQDADVRSAVRSASAFVHPEGDRS